MARTETGQSQRGGWLFTGFRSHRLPLAPSSPGKTEGVVVLLEAECQCQGVP